MGRYADAAPAHGLPDTSVFKLQYLPRLNSDRAVLWSILKKKSRATTWCPQICNPPKIRANTIAQRRPIFLPYASAPAVLPPQDGGLAWPGGGWAGRQRAVNGRQHQGGRDNVLMAASTVGRCALRIFKCMLALIKLAWQLDFLHGKPLPPLATGLFYHQPVALIVGIPLAV